MAPIDGLVSPDYLVLRARATVDPDFIAYVLRSPWGIAQMTGRLRGIGGVSAGMVRTPRINADDLRSIEIWSPSLGKQGAISNFLDYQSERIADLSTSLQRLTGAGTALALGRFADAVTPFPLGTVGYYFDVALGKMLDEKRVDSGNQRLYLRNTNVQWARVDLTDLKTMTFRPGEEERYSVRRGDLLVCEGGDPGRCAVWDGPDGMFIQKALLRVRPHGDASVRYLAWMLRLRHFRGDFRADGTGATILHLPAERLRALRIPLPGSELQAELAQAADKLRCSGSALDEAAASMRRRLAEYCDALITEAITGQLDVTAVSDAQMDERLHEAVESATA